MKNIPVHFKIIGTIAYVLVGFFVFNYALKMVSAKDTVQTWIGFLLLILIAYLTVTIIVSFIKPLIKKTDEKSA